MAFSPDGRSFVSGHLDGTVWIRRVDSSASNEITFKHQAGVRAVSFSPDGSKVLTASDDWTGRIWDASTGRSLTPPMMHQGDLRAAAFSGDGRFVVTAGSDKSARVWETATGRPVCLPLQHQAAVQAVALSQDGSTILTGSHDSTARTWALPRDPPWQLRLESKADVRMASFHPDGKRLITVSQKPGQPNHAQLFDLQTGVPLGAGVEMGIDKLVGCAINKDERLLAATENGSIQVWDLRNGHKVENRVPRKGAICAISLHPNGVWVLTGWDDGQVQLWDLRTGQLLGEPLPHEGEAHALALSSDGKRALVGCWDRWAHLWDLEGRQELKRFVHQDNVWAVGFSPDGRSLATGGISTTIRIWNASGEFEQLFALAHPAAANTVAFSHTGRLLATGCADGAARLWDLVSGKQIGPPLFHDLSHSSKTDRWTAGQIRSVEFSPDDTQILTAGTDQSLRTWPLPKPWSGSIDEIIRHIQEVTVMELDPAGAPGDLDLPSWRKRRIQTAGLH